MQNNALLRLETNRVRPALCKATVIIDKEFVNSLYNEAVLSQQKSIHAYGFHKGQVPIEYIKQNFNISMMEHLKEFLFHYFVISFLHKEIREQKIFAAGQPRLTNIEISPDQDAAFHFDLTTFSNIPFQNWKYFPFKAPKRKRYKDLDRQVMSFIKQEKELLKQNEESTVHVGDWICFSAQLVDSMQQPVFKGHKEQLWIRIGNEAGDEEYQYLFLGKKIGERFFTDENCIQSYFSSQIDTNYTFLIEIEEVIHNGYFCFNQFKKHFKVKTNKEMLQHLIEVFSFRNDLSQRQLMVEEALNLLLNRHPFDISKHLVLRQEKEVLESIKDNPDYHVYRAQKDFRDYVKRLAAKQIKETILIDQLASRENITVDQEDIKSYLNLTKRPRMKDFIYFEQPETKFDGREIPISSEQLKQTCLREKTLNYIIYHLTRK